MTGKIKRHVSEIVLNRLLLAALIMFLVLMVTSGFVWLQPSKPLLRTA